MNSNRRRSFEAGHRPKFLVVADESAECARAIHFAARRAARIGAGITMLAVADPGESHHWLGVAEELKAEAEDKARGLLDRQAKIARQIAGIEPEMIIRTGLKADEIRALIEEDADISFLVLGAGTGADGPGPLVLLLAGKTAGSFPIPVVIVPGGLTDSEIDALA